jgi:hypothetical protein
VTLDYGDAGREAFANCSAVATPRAVPTPPDRLRIAASHPRSIGRQFYMELPPEAALHDIE